MKKIDFKALLVSILAVASIVLVSMIITKNSMSFYLELKRPSFAPKPIVFVVAWSILYMLLALTVYKMRDDKKVLALLFINLVINVIWPIIFFRFNLVFFAMIWLGILVISTICLLLALYKRNKLFFGLNLIYFGWCLFALYLNYSIYCLNK